MKKPVLFSGIQPSGDLHIGTYIGAMKNWVELQDQYDCLFSIVDMHAITVRQDPSELRKRCYDVLAIYIASGISPEKNLIFCQSHVPEHPQLMWILNCFTYMGELSRMTQFKDKSQKQGANISVGLFDYPVLMAADILLYGTSLVPVGEDQKQHLEITRDIALRFNNLYGDVFTIPEPFIPKVGARIMGLLDPTKKMSKSTENPNDLINLLDIPEVILKKMQRAVTDSGSEVYFDAENKPGIANLLTIFSTITQKSISQLEIEYRTGGYGKFKKELGEELVEFLRPVQDKFKILRSDPHELDKILQSGAEAARVKAGAVLKKVHEVIGFVTL